MTIQKAIESGRFFHRPKWDFSIGVHFNLFMDLRTKKQYILTMQDVIAKDWKTN